MKTLSLVVAVASLALACGTSSSTPSTGAGTETAPTGAPSEEATPAEEAPVTGACASPDETPETFGAKIAAKGRSLTSLADVAKDPKSYEDQKILLTGVVRASCLKKGCWMEVRPAEDRSGDSITVRFKDYEFFVPLNARGSVVTFEGVVTVKTLTAGEVAHLEEEGATFANKRADGSVEQVEVTAFGVEMCGRDRTKE